MDHSHERIPQTHHPYYQTIHTQAESNYHLVKLHNPLISAQALFHQPLLHGMYEIPVQKGVGQQIQNFFDSVPDIIQSNVFFGNLQSSRHPDVVDGDVDCCNKYCNDKLQPRRFSIIREDDGDAVDNDLKQELNLLGTSTINNYRSLKEPLSYLESPKGD